jgi:hypothetical protein
MFRVFGSAVLVVFVGVLALSAKEWKDVTITKIDGDKVTVKMKDKDDKEVEATWTLAKDAKILRGKDFDKEVSVENLSKLLDKAKKGVRTVSITTDGKDTAKFEDKQMIKEAKLKGGKKKDNR